MNIPLISIIIPAYNSEKFLHFAIQSALEQTYKNIEIIIVDDGSSTRKCQEISEQFQKQSFHPILYYHLPNQGPAAARNYGLRKARGEFISFLDSDDFYENYKLSLQLNLLKDLPQDYAGVFGAAAVFLNKDPSRISFTQPPRIDGFAYQALLEKNMYLHLSCGSLLRKTALEAVGGFDESLQYGEDLYLLLRLADQFKVKTHPEIVYWERKRKGSLSRANPVINLEHSLKFIEKLQRLDKRTHQKIFDMKRKKAYFHAAATYLFMYKDYEKFCFYMQQGVERYGFPDNYKEWIGFLFSKMKVLTKFFF